MASNISPTSSTHAVRETKRYVKDINTMERQEETTQLTRQCSKVSDGGERDTDDISLCFLCQHDFTVPKLLPCLHTLCKDCLIGLARQNNGDESVSCPQCRDSTAIPIEKIETLVDNTLVMFMRDDGNLQEIITEVECSSCNHGEMAVSRCINCQDFLCEHCIASHKSLKMFRDHELVGINEWRKQSTTNAISNETLCVQHNGETISFYCETCKKPICKDCADLNHQEPNHNTCSLLEGAVICRRTVEKLLNVSRQTEAKFKGALEILHKMKSGLTETTSSLRNQVQIAFKNERDTLEEREREFLTKIDVIETQRGKTVNTHIENVENILEKLWTAFDLTETLIDSGNDYHLLKLEPVISGRLQMLYKTHPELPPSDLTIVDLTEEYEPDEEPKYVNDTTSKGEEEQLVWELETTLGDRGSGEGQFDWCRGVAASLDSHTVVADWGNDRVQVFDANRTFACVLNTDNHHLGRMSMPQDVACLLDGRYIVVDKSRYAKVYSSYGKFWYRFSTLVDNETTDVELTCVTVDRRSRILIGDSKRNVVTIHYVDGQIIKTVPAVGPEHIASTSRDLLVVSCPRKQKVRVMNHDGRFMFQMESFGACEKLKPRGVACDDEDNIYVVHKERGGEKSVHMFNSLGKYISCVAKHLREPYDIDIAPGGKVIVSDDDAVKIFSRKSKE